MKIRFIKFIPAIIWLLIVTILLVMPGPDVPSISFLDKLDFDKWVHAGLFGGLTFLIAFPFVQKNISTLKLLIKIATCCTLYGILMEYVQKYLAFERDFDIWDMVADCVGCIIAVFFLRWLVNKLARRKVD